MEETTPTKGIYFFACKAKINTLGVSGLFFQRSFVMFCLVCAIFTHGWNARALCLKHGERVSISPDGVLVLSIATVEKIEFGRLNVTV